MKLFPTPPKTIAAGLPELPQRGSGRRALLVGTGAAAAAAAAAHLASRGVTVAPAGPVAVAPPEPAGDGYQVTPHVLRYYETAKV